MTANFYVCRHCGEHLTGKDAAIDKCPKCGKTAFREMQFCRDPMAPMTVNEAAFHLDFYLTELRDNHEGLLRKILYEFTGTSVNEELLLFDRAAAALRALARQGKATFEVDPEKGCDVTFKAKIPPKPAEA